MTTRYAGDGTSDRTIYAPELAAAMRARGGIVHLRRMIRLAELEQRERAPQGPASWQIAPVALAVRTALRARP